MSISDDEREIDVESDEDELGGRRSTNGLPSDKRAHHNALERKRRDHIKESFIGLRDAVPTLQGDKSSRAQILKKASEYISFMRRKTSAGSKEIEDLKRQNTHMEAQIRALEAAKAAGNFTSSTEVLQAEGLLGEPAPLATPEDRRNASATVAESLAYEAGSDESGSDGGASGGVVRTVQPGQSLLLAHNGDGPAKKKFKY